MRSKRAWILISLFVLLSIGCKSGTSGFFGSLFGAATKPVEEGGIPAPLAIAMAISFGLVPIGLIMVFGFGMKQAGWGVLIAGLISGTLLWIISEYLSEIIVGGLCSMMTLLAMRSHYTMVAVRNHRRYHYQAENGGTETEKADAMRHLVENEANLPGRWGRSLLTLVAPRVNTTPMAESHPQS